ncbi:DUF4167 domain-containing protein [Falsiroseomonas sp.]|uniref:DUF4167 domain-containing protein n=1 Tax=Falsiroseomonas sp. TaxID=2870721 RepID=UPI003F712B36
MNRNHIFDSNGPDMRLRGTAQQLFEKYLQLGRDATGASDRVMAESYFQHAEHYFRILNAMSQAQQQQGGQPYPPQRRYQNGPDQEGGEAAPQGEAAEGAVTVAQSSPYGHQNGNGQDRHAERGADRGSDRGSDRSMDRDRDDTGMDQRDERDERDG